MQMIRGLVDANGPVSATCERTQLHTVPPRLTGAPKNNDSPMKFDSLLDVLGFLAHAGAWTQLRTLKFRFGRYLRLHNCLSNQVATLMKTLNFPPTSAHFCQSMWASEILLPRDVSRSCQGYEPQLM